ncbi:MAG: DUF4363 family protein [Ruthenibacterium sp.]
MMRRVTAAFALLAIIFCLSLCGHFAVRCVTDTALEKLCFIRSYVQVQNYKDAKLSIDNLAAYYQQQQHILELFIKRDVVANLTVNLNGLSAYATHDTVADLYNEIDKVTAQVAMMKHLFFSIF